VNRTEVDPRGDIFRTGRKHGDLDRHGPRGVALAGTPVDGDNAVRFSFVER
jgi:hypothetical protein